jgi:hypothetical protein
MTDATTLAPTGGAVAAERPPEEGSPSAGGRWRPGWGPGAVLLGGLALSAALVASSGDVDLHTLHVIHGDGAQVHNIKQVYIAGWTSPDYDPFADGRLRLLTPLLAFVYLFSVTAIGLPLVKAIRGSDAWPQAVRLLAGFLPGYLMVLAPLQVLYGAVGTITASWIALVALPLVAAALHRDALTRGRSAAARAADRRGQARAWIPIIAFVILLCAIFRLQAGRNFMVPDSISVFLQAADAQVKGALGSHLAQWDQQSDEWVFNAPLMFTSSAGRDQLFAFWATEFVALASFSALVFGLVCSVAWRRRMLAGALAVGAVLASTPAITPWNDISLFGGQNPAMWLGHPGRLIGIVAPWVALMVLGNRSKGATIAILFATAGLAFTSVHGTGFTVVAVVCAAAWHVLRGRARPRGHTAGLVTAGAIHTLALVALAAPLLAYYGVHHTDYPDNLGWVLVAGAGLAMLAAAAVALTSAPENPSKIAIGPGLARAAAAVAALATGFFLSNNLVSSFADGKVRDALGAVLPGFDQAILSRGIAANRELAFPTFTGEQCAYSGHCISFPYFIAAYGVLTVLALAGWLALGRLSDQERVNRRRAAWLVVIAALGLAFAIVDFTGQEITNAWVLTRFIEVPYYALLAFAAVALVGSRSRFTVVAGTAVLAVWTVVPFVNSHIPEQMVKNANWLIGAVL